MQQNVMFAPGADPEAQAIQRKMMLAQALRQSQDPMQGQMVSGRYIAPSWSQGLANMLKSYAGRKGEEQAMSDYQALQDRRKQEGTQEASKYIELLRGKPSQTVSSPVTHDDEGNALPAAQTPNVPGDPNAALSFAMQARNPMVQAAGQAQLKNITTGPKWEKVELPNSDGSKRVGFVNVNSPDPISTFQAGGTAPVKAEFVEGQAVNPYQTAPGTVIPKQLAPDSVVMRGADGKLVPNAAVIAAKSQVAAAGKPVTNVSVNTATKPFLNEIGKGAGEQVVNDFAGARAGAQVLGNVQQIRQGLGNAILGPGANVRIKLGQIGELLGVNGKDATEQLQNTRNVIQGLARQELAAAGAMKGQGQITESERAILRKAESGQVEELTAPEVNTLLTALEKTARYRVGIHQQNMERLKNDPNASGVVDYMRVETPSAPTAGQAPDGFRILEVK